ncbi:hypothetical protein JCM10212_002019 [Sporobolomyces blumeae]
MATQTSSIAFQDDFTHSHGGGCFFVAVDPNFPQDVSDAAQLIARSRPEGERQQFVSDLSSAANDAQPPAPAQPEREQGDDDEDMEVEAPKVEESEETRDKKRAVVRQVLESIRNTRLEATDKEFEGFANLVLSFVLSLYPVDHAEFASHVLTLADAVTWTDRTANPSHSARYASLATVFNSLPSSPSLHSLRLTVLLKLVSFAAQNDDFAVVAPVFSKFESYLVSWGFGPGTQGEEEGNAAVSQVVELLVAKGKLAEARTLLISHLSSPSAVEGQAATPSSSAAHLASTLIALSLALPTVFDFAELTSTRFPSLENPASSDLKSLLATFQSGDLDAFNSTSFPVNVSQGLVLEKEPLEKKFKLVKLAELCSERVGETVSYGEIAKALGLNVDGEDEGEEVETWVIDAIRASLLTGRLSQPTHSLSITRALPRSFEQKHWKTIESRLESWKRSIDNILVSTQRGLGGAGGGGGGGDRSKFSTPAGGKNGDESATGVLGGQQQQQQQEIEA